MKAFLLRLATAVFFVPALVAEVVLWVFTAKSHGWPDVVLRWSDK